jgi:hypothetical protein
LWTLTGHERHPHQPIRCCVPKESERHKKAQALEREIEGMLAQHNEDMLKVGAAIRLMTLGRLDAVLPLDDEQLLDAAGRYCPTASRTRRL